MNDTVYVELDDEAPKPIVIPTDKIPLDTLKALIEEFVLREGTDYGSAEHTLEQKSAQVLSQIKSGDVLVTFDFITETSSLMRKEEYQAQSS